MLSRHEATRSCVTIHAVRTYGQKPAERSRVEGQATNRGVGSCAASSASKEVPDSVQTMQNSIWCDSQHFVHGETGSRPATSSMCPR